MMNRNSSKDSFVRTGGLNLHNNGIHNAPVSGLFSHRRAMSFTNTEDFSNHGDLFSRNRRSLSVASSDESELKVRLGRLAFGSTKPHDLLSSNEGGKHDYDWLLTPPGTPGKESQPTSVAPRRHSFSSGSTIKTSGLSVSPSESIHPLRPLRSSSAARSSISTAKSTNYSNRNSNILNTSSASVSSYIRSSTLTTRSSLSARTTTASSRAISSRASTPSRTRPTPTTTSNDRTIKASQNSRSSTPTPRPQTPGNSSPPTVRSSSRPSTPSRRNPTPSRPSSPVSRIRIPSQPIIPPDFPHETPPNLRTTLPERPLSAGRSRPGAAMTVKGYIETTNPVSIRRPSSPIVSRGRLNANGHVVETLESRRTSLVPDSTTRKPIKTSNSECGTGFGRSISKKSLDMAIKHMDIRNGGVRPLSGTTLFPQSIRSTKNGNFNNVCLANKVKVKPVSEEHRRNPYSSRITEVDMYESSRYDTILLKEDSKNTSWLHTTDENTDQGPFFDNGFEPLPEPFGPL